MDLFFILEELDHFGVVGLRALRGLDALPEVRYGAHDELVGAREEPPRKRRAYLSKAN